MKALLVIIAAWLTAGLALGWIYIGIPINGLDWFMCITCHLMVIGFYVFVGYALRTDI